VSEHAAETAAILAQCDPEIDITLTCTVDELVNEQCHLQPWGLRQ
jgi:hypothetical protein